MNLKEKALYTAMGLALTSWPDDISEEDILAEMANDVEPEASSTDGEFIVWQPFEDLPLSQVAEIIEDTAKTLERFAKDVVDGLAQGQIEDCDYIIVRWHVDDVLTVAPDLTAEQCRAVLQHVRQSHDCTQGITWDTIKCAVEIIKAKES